MREEILIGGARYVAERSGDGWAITRDGEPITPVAALRAVIIATREDAAKKLPR